MADAHERLPRLIDDGRTIGRLPRAIFDRDDRLRRLALDGPDQLRDLLRGTLRILGELTDFLGHDGEAATLLARSRGLDGGVEGEEIGLLGDTRDRGHDG